MEVDLTARLGRRVYGGDKEGGAYYEWDPNDMPMLRHANFGASKLTLQQWGFAVPRYYDSARFGFVVQGKGICGLILPEKEEKRIELKKGDSICLPQGCVTWWYNREEHYDFAIFFLGDTSKGNKPGILTEYLLTGSHSILSGFSTEFMSRAFDLDEEMTKTLIESQKKRGIIKLNEEFKMPEPRKEDFEGYAFRSEEKNSEEEEDMYDDYERLEKAKYLMVDSSKLPLVAETGLALDIVKVFRDGLYAPIFSNDGAFRVTYMYRGSGKFQVCGPNGKLVQDTTFRAGTVFVLPMFYSVSKLANVCGMDWFSILTHPTPSFTSLAGKNSVLRNISPETLQASFNVLPHFEQKMRSKRKNDEMFFKD